MRGNDFPQVGVAPLKGNQSQLKTTFKLFDGSSFPHPGMQMIQSMVSDGRYT